MINVTKTFFPPIEEFNKQVQRIWDNQWLTNRGSLVLELEQKLEDFLGLDQSKIIIMNNGTFPIQVALKVLAKGGEVITTPFSYVATTAAIVWENCTPVFVDINPKNLTIDESKIEAAITENTTCILATHVFGNPCNVEEIDRIAKKFNLKVIYDAAHCFGVEYKGKSIFEYGDVSTCSFHATKLFHTGEGGALFTKDRELFHRCFFSHNFGHKGQTDFHGLGINGKISELQAAIGLAVLPHMESIINSRKQVVQLYNNHLDFSKLSKLKLREETQWNYSYYPIVFDEQVTVALVQKALNEQNIFPRRYFYPSLNSLPYVKHEIMPNSDEIASRILCLPLFDSLDSKIVLTIIKMINSLLKC